MRKMTLTQEIQETLLGKFHQARATLNSLVQAWPGVVGTKCPRSSGRAGLGDDGTPEVPAGGASGVAALWCQAREPLG